MSDTCIHFALISIDIYRYRLMDMSAEIGEAHYGKARSSFAEQTQSLGIQIHYNCLAALEAGHTCGTVFKFRPYVTNAMDHILITRRMEVFKFDSTWRKGIYNARRYLLKRIETTDGLDWASVGVFEIVGIARPLEKIYARDVRGRGIIQEHTKRMFTWTEDMHQM